MKKKGIEEEQMIDLTDDGGHIGGTRKEKHPGFWARVWNWIKKILKL